eukprot:sb/3472770/
MISAWAWSPIVRDAFIPFDLESTPLQIKTDSTATISVDMEMIWVIAYTADGTKLAGVSIKFRSPMKYAIAACTGDIWPQFQVQPPEEVDKIWTIRKTNTTLSIECNGVELVYYQFSNRVDNRCVSKWGGDIVDKIQFQTGDTASDSYAKNPAIGNETHYWN